MLDVELDDVVTLVPADVHDQLAVGPLSPRGYYIIRRVDFSPVRKVVLGVLYGYGRQYICTAQYKGNRKLDWTRDNTYQLHGGAEVRVELLVPREPIEQRDLLPQPILEAGLIRVGRVSIARLLQELGQGAAHGTLQPTEEAAVCTGELGLGLEALGPGCGEVGVSLRLDDEMLAGEAAQHAPQQHRIGAGELCQLCAGHGTVAGIGPFREDADVDECVDAGADCCVGPRVFPGDVPGRLGLPEGFEEGVPDSNPLGFVGKGACLDAFQGSQ